MTWRELEATARPVEADVVVVPNAPVVEPPSVEVVGAALGHWPPDYALRLIDGVRTSLDCEWWAAIACTTLLVRSALLPISLETMRHTGRMQKAKPEIDALTARAGQDTSKDATRTQMYQRQMAAILEKHGVKVWLIFAFPLAQLPVFTSMFFGLQRLGSHYPDAASGGALWFSDLTAADPSLALPVATSVLFLGMVETGADAAGTATSQGKMFKNGMRALALLMVPLTSSMPASVFCYWLTANAISLVQSFVLNKVPGARKFLKLPPLPKRAASTSATADIREAWEKAKQALTAARQRDKPPQVAANVYETKKLDNAFLASRPYEKVDTYTQRPPKTGSLPK